ncbi:hypothetical protein BDN72DRAFT_841925 [Pluteus cervinus]|uniref:Uncharacterized protein n=1 Tax=Pluteus cervinus TaxID=181527 RepID=A0ACD3ARL5_9AGAR|nr:hypothetical protein BDN72DRAFT_841925 [Pluteus cervinus]
MADCEETSLILVPFEANILLELPFFDEASLVSSTPQRTAPTTPSLLRYSPASTHSRKASNEMLSNLVDVFSHSSRSSSLSSSPPKVELVPTTSPQVSKPSPRIPDWVVPRPPERHISWHLKFKAKSPPPTPPGPIAPTCAPSSPVQVVERAVRPKHSPPRPIPIPTRVDIQKDFDKFDANDIENGVDEEDDADEQSPLAATLTRMNDLYGFFSHLVKDSKR